MFSYFKITKKQRKTEVQEEPKDKLTWIKHGLSEFIGTILLSLALAGLSTIVAGQKEAVEFYLLHPVLIGFYAGFVVVGLILFIFLRWSCDLNPAVTITRMIKGRNTYRYGFYKIGIQFISAIIAGLIIYAFGKLGNGTTENPDAVNHAISAVGAASKEFGKDHFGWTPTVEAGASWIFFIELFMTAILLFPIFSSIISDKYRDFLIMFIISMAVWMGVLSGTAAINPARGLSQQVPGLFFGYRFGNSQSTADIVSATIAMEAGTLLAPFLYVSMQGFLVKYFNPFVIKAISFRNYRSNNMKYDIQVDQDKPIDPNKSTKGPKIKK